MEQRIREMYEEKYEYGKGRSPVNQTKITAADLVEMLQEAFIAGYESPSELMEQEIARIMTERLSSKKEQQDEPKKEHSATKRKWRTSTNQGNYYDSDKIWQSATLA